MCDEAENGGLETVKVLELFSGIGGMHFAIDQASRNVPIQYEVVAAMDISDVANKVYKHNFPEVNHISGNICGLTAKKVNALGVSAIFMSPPCQPFTRQGLQKDLEDTRTQTLGSHREVVAADIKLEIRPGGKRQGLRDIGSLQVVDRDADKPRFRIPNVPFVSFTARHSKLEIKVLHHRQKA